MGNLSPRPPSSQRLPPILPRVPLSSYVVLGHPITPTEEELRRVHSTRREARKVRKRDVSCPTVMGSITSYEASDICEDRPPSARGSRHRHPPAPLVDDTNSSSPLTVRVLPFVK